MRPSIRFGDFVKQVNIKQKTLSFNALTENLPGSDAIKLRPIDRARLLYPYISTRFSAQLKAVIPLVVYLILFQLIILRQPIQDSAIISIGLASVIVGLMCFMEGIKVGLMPFGEVIGHHLPQKSSLPVVLTIAFLLGIGVTLAEPAIGALQAAGAIVSVDKAPYLYALLNLKTTSLVTCVGMGVGLAAVIGTMRFLYGWSLKPLIFITLVPTIGLTLYCMQKPELIPVIGLAWDSGAVTTGPVTVPLVLSLGIGIAAAAGKENSSLSGFGIVTLASLFPIIGVLILAIYVEQTMTIEAIQFAAFSMASTGQTQNILSSSPYSEIVGGIRAILPLVLFLYCVLAFILKAKLPQSHIVVYGIVLSIIGMIIFNLGLTYGLANLGNQSGSIVPAAFFSIEGIDSSPLYNYALGVTIALLFAYILGFGATLAEPALNALGITVENLTHGALSKKTLMMAVSLGVGAGITLGLVKIIFNVPLACLLIPAYSIAIVMSYFSSESFVNVAWDSAGVTTGPVTVPLVLTMGLGFGNSVEAIEGFGILSMASIGPIISVLTIGLWLKYKLRQGAS